MLRIKILIAGCLLMGKVVAQQNAIAMADSEMKRNPEAWMIDFSTEPKWNYCHGLVMQALLQVGEKIDDQRYFNYVYPYADTMVYSDGSIRTYRPHEYNIDRVNTGKILFPLLARTNEIRFQKALVLQRNQMRSHPRTSGGSFWHKKVYPHQVWLDGLYMAGPFLAQYAAQNDDEELFNDVSRQLLDVHKHMYDPQTGLYYHGWDERREQKWANKVTGLSPNFWSRSIGWYMMAIVDVLDYLPKEHVNRPRIISIFQELATSLEKFRDKDTGMWYQVTDAMDREGNYLESTGSIMFIYAWTKGAQKGYLDKTYFAKAEKAYLQYVDRFVKREKDGTLCITDCCAVAGLGGDKNYRDGSFAYYINEPVRNNDPKAVGPFIMTSLMLDK